MCLLSISIHDGDRETEAHMFTAVVSMNSEERGWGEVTWGAWITLSSAAWLIFARRECLFYL